MWGNQQNLLLCLGPHDWMSWHWVVQEEPQPYIQATSPCADYPLPFSQLTQAYHLAIWRFPHGSMPDTVLPMLSFMPSILPSATNKLTRAMDVWSHSVNYTACWPCELIGKYFWRWYSLTCLAKTDQFLEEIWAMVHFLCRKRLNVLMYLCLF